MENGLTLLDFLFVLVISSSIGYCFYGVCSYQTKRASLIDSFKKGETLSCSNKKVSMKTG